MPRASTRDLVLAALFASLTAAGAFVALPMVGPVPFTLQVFFVLLAGFVLGPRLGTLSMIMYLLLGLVAPVYAGGLSGIAALVGPTGGYIVGFVLSPLVTGLARRRLQRTGTPALFAIGAAALLPIYGVGAAWLAVSLHSASYRVVLGGGVLQFVPLDLAKALAAALTARSLVSLPLGLPCASTEGPLTSASAWPRRRRLMRPRSYSPMKSVELPSRYARILVAQDPRQSLDVAARRGVPAQRRSSLRASNELLRRAIGAGLRSWRGRSRHSKNLARLGDAIARDAARGSRCRPAARGDSGRCRRRPDSWRGCA